MNQAKRIALMKMIIENLERENREDLREFLRELEIQQEADNELIRQSEESEQDGYQERDLYDIEDPYDEDGDDEMDSESEISDSEVEGDVSESESDDEGGEGEREGDDEDEEDRSEDDERMQMDQEQRDFEEIPNPNPKEPERMPFFNSPELQKNLFPSSKIDLKTAILFLLSWQSKNHVGFLSFLPSLPYGINNLISKIMKISLEALEELLKILSLTFLPDTNLLPKTVYKLHQLVGIDLDLLEEHVCENDCFLFPRLPKAAWRDHAGDCCPDCGSKRFVVSGGCISPKKKFFRVPLGFQIENLKINPRFQDSLLKMRNEITETLSSNDSFWGASIAQDLISEHDIIDEFSKLFLLSVGLDGVNCFKSATYSVWPVAFKIWNLHPEERTSKEFLLLGCLIPGDNLYFLIHFSSMLTLFFTFFHQGDQSQRNLILT